MKNSHQLFANGASLTPDELAAAKDIQLRLRDIITEAKSRSPRSTIGIVADLGMYSPEALISCLRNKDATNGIRLAKQLKSRFIVLAGHLMSPAAGALSMPT